VVTIPSQAGTKNQVYDSAHCSGAFAFINSTTDTGDFPTPPFNQSTLIGTTVTPTQVVTSWTVYNYDGSVAGTATYTSALSQPVGYDSATLSCLSLLSQFALPTGDDAGLYVFPGLAGPIQDLIVSGGIFETYLPVVGPTAKGLPLRFDSVGEVARGSQTIRNWPWLAPGEGVVPNRGFVICMKSSWNLLPVPPAYSGIYPPTDSMGATYYEPTPANAGGHTVFQNPIANLFLVEWVQNPDGSLTIQSPVFLSSLSTPGVLNFDPSMVPETYGEIGFRNTFT
jgi:hypothetical protein